MLVFGKPRRQFGDALSDGLAAGYLGAADHDIKRRAKRRTGLDTALAALDHDAMSRAMPSSPGQGFYPAVEPYAAGMLDVTDGHRLYYEQCGNPHGRPVVVLHGGPGGGINPTMRRFHDPGRYRIILFDQRGCGRSTPSASIDANTTWDLVADIERLRTHLGIGAWQLFGGSWGSTLALAYAEACPERVTGLVLRGVFLLRAVELDWFYQSGARWFFPAAYQDLIAGVPEAERGNLIQAYHRRVTSADMAIALPAARAWMLWESRLLSLLPDADRVTLFPDPLEALAFARIECHYFVNFGFFSRDNELLENIGRIRHLPCVIVQGRYDMVTPPRSAFDLAAAWPSAVLTIVPDAGHAMTEPGIAAALVDATKALA